MSKRRFNTFALCCILLILSGCGLIINGSKQRLKVVSDEPGATVFINNEAVDSTPCVIKVARKSTPPELRLEKAGYAKVEVPLTKKFNETTILNFLNPFGWLIDWGFGATIKYRPLDTIALKPLNRKI